MFDRILFLGARDALSACLARSLEAEGYEITRAGEPPNGSSRAAIASPYLVVVNAIDQDAAWLRRLAERRWPVPVIALIEAVGAGALPTSPDWHYLHAPFAFHDLLMLVQDHLHQRTLDGQRPSQLSAGVVDRIDQILKTLRQDLRARCVVLSSSGGRLIKTVGVVDQSMAISLAALMSASFSATAKAAQLLGQGEMFDSSLQESEGYGLYAIRLHNKLILSVAFSARITIGMVRHYAAQAAVDILEILLRETGDQDTTPHLDIGSEFRETVDQVLGRILGD